MAKEIHQDTVPATEGPAETAGTPTAPKSNGRQEAPAEDLESRALLAWQEKLLPYTLAFLFCVAAVFLSASLYEFHRLHGSIFDSEQGAAVKSVIPAGLDADASNYPALAQLEVTAQLEAYLLEQRYHQASVSEISRIWLQFLGFQTGMILALVGAFFILSKITDANPIKLN